ncbi:unnamed protein product [Urochloa humidicola]
MEGLIPLVYRAIMEYKKAREAVAIGSLLYGDQPCHSRAPPSTLFGDPAAGWYAAASLSPAASPPARASLVSPLLRPVSRRHCAGVLIKPLKIRVRVLNKEGHGQGVISKGAPQLTRQIEAAACPTGCRM